MSVSASEPPRLAPPGAGIPAYQRFVGKRLLLPGFCLCLSWPRAIDLVERQARTLIDLAGVADERRLTRRVLVPRQIGLEDSSRYHSYAMVLEHLSIIGDRIAEIVVCLTCGREPPDAVRVEDLKPRGATTAARAQADYRTMVARFRHRMEEEVGDRDAGARFDHPWFGALAAYQWICFTPFHQTIHIKQVRRILSARER